MSKYFILHSENGLTLIGILHESDEWSDWKLRDELESELSHLMRDPAENKAVLMIDMQDADAIERALSCDMLISRVFASAVFRGHEQSHRTMEAVAALAESEGIPLVNPQRAHSFEVDKHLAAENLRNAGVATPEVIAWGTPVELADTTPKSRSGRSNQPEPDAWPYPGVIKPNCGGRTTYTAVLHNPAEAQAFLATAPDLVFIVEPFIEAANGFLTRIEVVDGQAAALTVKRSVAANGLSSYHEGSTYERYPDCPAAVTDAVLETARLLDIRFGSFDVIEAVEGSFIIDANSVSNVSEDCTELFGFDLMAEYAKALAARYRALRNPE